MFSKEEAKKLRQQFWIFFGKRFPRKWILYNTKIREINLKFSFDTKEAFVSFDIETGDELIRQYYFERFESLKNIMKTDISEELIFDPNYFLSNGKEISRIYMVLDNVNIHKQTDWPEVFGFFNENMSKFEAFWLEYADFITA